MTVPELSLMALPFLTMETMLILPSSSVPFTAESELPTRNPP